MKLSIPVVETIQKRHSVRTYEKKPLLPQDRRQLKECMARLDNPFGVPVHLYLIDKTVGEGGEKLGIYGVIKGAGSFLGLSVPDLPLAPLAAGYEFENLVLYATHMGLGTVWLAATFSRDSFAAAMGVPKEELFPAISPVGYPARARSLSETLMRTAMHSSARKSWEELFFGADFKTPLTREQAGAYATALEMVRLASSATNAQPWRVRREGDHFHFYTTCKPGLSQGEQLIKRVDVGIALAHFHQTALEQGLEGAFEQLPQDGAQLPANTYYLTSWHAGASK